MKQVLIAVDQVFNTLLGGMADETLSARAYRQRDKHPWRMWVIDRLFFFDGEHCYNSWLSEINRKHLPTVYRQDTGDKNE